jgi:glucan phosphoethanolaminetransferase (alkaline phosphatase superfamily)
MFWFAGLVGMGLESRRIREWFAFSSGALILPRNIPSFNPFPALVIGVTGAAMSAHAQTYQFQVRGTGQRHQVSWLRNRFETNQVDVHVLWGSALVGCALLRCLTYCLLWVSPPRSAVPSRPPTEALASFCLASGGLLFMLSTEEITFAAMRRGRDGASTHIRQSPYLTYYRRSDVMMFLNFAVAITCFAFCWSLSIVAFKAWLKSRARRSAPYFQ